MDAQSIETLKNQLNLLLNENDEERKAAEASLNAACLGNPNAFMASLLQLIRVGTTMQPQTEEAKKEMAETQKVALIHFKGRLRKYFHNAEKDVIWPALSQEVKEEAKQTPIWIILNSENEDVRKSAVPLLVDLAAKQIQSGEWPSAHNDILKLYCDNVANKGSVCFLQAVGEMLIGDREHLKNTNVGEAHGAVCQLAFAQGDMESRVMAIVFLANTVVGVEDRSSWEKLVGYGPQMVETLKELANGKVLVNGAWVEDEGDALNFCLEVVSSFVEIAEENSGFFKPFLHDLLGVCFAIVNGNEVEEELRQFCAEIIMCILADKPKMCQAVPSFNETMLETSIKLMLTVTEEHAVDDEEDYLYSVGERGLDAVVKAVGGAEMFPQLFPYIKKLIASDQWEQRFAGIICICQTTEYINKVDQLKTLQDMVPVVLQAIKDPHHVVRLAAARCIGQMAYDLAPVFQVHFCNEILDALISVFASDFTQRDIAVVNKALRAYVNFCDELTGADIAPVMDQLLNSFLKCLNITSVPNDDSMTTAKNIVNMRENAITSISVSAAVAGKRFVPYYDNIAQKVIACLTEPVDNGMKSGVDNRPVRAQAVDCISHIGAAVGHEVFYIYGVDVMKKLIEIKADGEIQDDDPVMDQLFEAFKKMVTALGPHFKQFVPGLIHQYITLLATREQEVSPFELQNPFDWTFFEGAEGDGYSAVKSSVIIEMTKCLSLIETIAKTDDLIDSVLEPVIEAVQPLISFQGTRVAISEVTSCLAVLLERLVIVNNSSVPDRIVDIIKGCFLHIKEEHMKDLELYAVYLAEVTDGLAKCIKSCGQVDIPQEAHQFVADRAFRILNESIEARMITIKKLNDANLDEEDREKIENDAQIEQTFRNGLISLAGALMANNGEKFMNVAGDLCKNFITQAFASDNPDDTVLGIYLCDDILNHLGASGFSMWPIFMNKLILACKHPRHDVRQAAAYGIIWAAKDPNFNAEMVNMVITNLHEGFSLTVLNPALNDDEDAMLATDNIVAALHAIIVYKHQFVEPANLKEISIACYSQLPLTVDYTENLEVNKSLITQVLAQHPAVLGENNCNLPLIITGFAKLYKTMMSSDPLDVEIRDCLKMIGEEKFKEILPQIHADGQKYVERLWKDVFQTA